MNAPEPPAEVRKTVFVHCDPESAFRVWTEQINAWWPKSHSLSGDPATTVHLESRQGGRLYERTSEGVEHEWGEVTAWDPPHHFAYRWYLGSGQEKPTLVNVHFTAHEAGSTRVEVVHRGPELIGDLWSRNSSRYSGAWDNLLPAYVAAADDQ
jgi:uncharacterized protein YndB with AHSA1/START domain